MRFARSLTYQGDFTLNIGDYKLNKESDTDLSDAFNINILDKYQLDLLSCQVKEVIYKEILKELERMVKEFFISSDLNYKVYQNF